MIVETLEKYQYETDKNTDHSYGPLYDKLFESFFDKPIQFLEIGIWRGGSMRLWNKCFPKAKFLFMDITDAEFRQEAREEIEEAGRSELRLCNAYSDEVINSLNKTFDIIVDDGPHTDQSFYFLVEKYSHLLNSGGLLVIEDIYKYELVDDLIKLVPEGFDYEIFDLREIKGRWDDIVFVIKKK